MKFDEEQGLKVKSRKYVPPIFKVQSPGSHDKLRELRSMKSQQGEHIMPEILQVPNGMGSGVWRSKRLLLACHTCLDALWKPICSNVKSGKKSSVRQGSGEVSILFWHSTPHIIPSTIS